MGVSLHWYVEPLDTEFGLFAANYHSRSPYLGTVSSRYYANTGFARELCGNIGVALASCGAFMASGNGQTWLARCAWVPRSTRRSTPRTSACTV